MAGFCMQFIYSDQREDVWMMTWIGSILSEPRFFPGSTLQPPSCSQGDQRIFMICEICEIFSGGLRGLVGPKGSKYPC